MNERYQIRGVYDLRTIQCLREIGVHEVIFDLRPRSLNFIQKHLLIDILKNSESLGCKIGLFFGHEKDFMIQDVLKDIYEYVKKENVFLILSGDYEINFVSSLGVSFYCIYDQDIKQYEYSTLDKCLGVYLYFDFLEGLYAQGVLSSWVRNFYSTFIERKNLEIILMRDWNSNIFPSLMELVDFDSECLPINDKVEVCFRNVDLNKLKSSFHNNV